MNVTKISQKRKNKTFLSIEKKYYRMRKKKSFYNYKKVFEFRKFCLFLRTSIKSFDLGKLIPEV